MDRNAAKEARATINHAVMTEIYKKNDRFIRLQTQFIPNLKTKTVTEKFYTPHEVVEGVPADITEMLEKKAHQGPKDIVDYPVLTSHWYGWYNEPLIKMDRTDGRYYHPNTSTEISRFGALMARSKFLMK